MLRSPNLGSLRRYEQSSASSATATTTTALWQLRTGDQTCCIRTAGPAAARARRGQRATTSTGFGPEPASATTAGAVRKRLLRGCPSAAPDAPRSAAVSAFAQLRLDHRRKTAAATTAGSRAAAARHAQAAARAALP
ncbi:MAG: hypothetical protein QM691_14260 [Opitutaceae bacterium]